MWIEYMHDVLDLNRDNPQTYINPLTHGSLLASADFHGAELEVVRSRCVSRVGVKGIVVRDSKFTFVVVTEKDEAKSMLRHLCAYFFFQLTYLLAIPKEHTIFRFQVPLLTSSREDVKTNQPDLIFELHGSQFENRPADRANKKFKWKNLDYL